MKNVPLIACAIAASAAVFGIGGAIAYTLNSREQPPIIMSEEEQAAGEAREAQRIAEERADFRSTSSAEVETLPIAEENPPEPLTPAEQYQVNAQAATKGFLANEAIALMDAEVLYNDVRPSLCDVIDGGIVPLDDIEALMTERFRRNGNDEEKAQKMAQGLMDATLKPGACF